MTLGGGTSDTLPRLYFRPFPQLRSLLEASAPPQAAASRSSLGILARAGREGAVARVARMLPRPPCLAAPLRPGKEGARAARPPPPPENRARPQGSAGLAVGAKVGLVRTRSLDRLSSPTITADF